MAKSRKSQVWYIDFMVGLFIVSMIIFVFFRYYGNLIDESDSEWQELIIDSKAISSYLVSSGAPADWTNDTVEVIGLTDGNYRINFTKLSRFANMSYKQAKDLMRTRFDFYFFLQSPNGTAINPVGLNATSPFFLVQGTRFVIYNSSIYRMVVHLWKD